MTRNHWKSWRRSLSLCCVLLSFLLAVSLSPLRSIATPPVPTTVGSTPHDTRSTRTLLQQGQTAYAAGDFQTAIQHWSTAAQLATDPENFADRSIALTYLSLAYQNLGEWSAATAAITESLQSLPIDRTQLTPEQTQLLAQALNTRGRLEFHLGQLQQALSTWQQATELYRRVQDSVGIAGSLINQAQALESSGFYRQACRTLLQAISIDHDCEFSATGSIESDIATLEQAFQHQSDVNLRSIGLRNLANTLRLMGYLNQSQALLSHQLKVADQSAAADQSATRLSLADTERALYQQSQALYDRTQRDRDRTQALTWAEQALHHYQTAIAQSAATPTTRIINLQAQLRHLSFLTKLHQDANANPQATVSWQPSLTQRIPQQIDTILNGAIANLPVSRTTIYAHLNLARSLTDFSPTDPRIAALIQTAIQQAETMKDARSQSYAFGTLGYWYEQQAQSVQTSDRIQYWTQAQQATQQALGFAQAIQAWDIAYEWQWQLGRIYQAQGNIAQSIAYYETATETLQPIRDDLRSIAAEIQFSFRDNVEPLYRELVALRLQTLKLPLNSPIEAQATLIPASDRDNLNQVIREIDALQLSELENFLRCNLTTQVEINQAQIDTTAAIVYPIILEKEIAVIVSLPTSHSQSNQLSFHRISIEQTTVHQTLDRLRQELEQRYVSPTGLTLSQQVYDWLIRPLQPTLQQYQIKTLVFVLDGALRNIPMAALHDRHHYLIEDYAIALTPSLHLLQPYPLKSQALQVLTFGLSQIRQDFPAHQDFAPLTNVETELQEIRSQVSAQTRLNQQFTSTALQSQIRTQTAAIVHLATHGQFSSNPDETFILAWDKRISIDTLNRILQERRDPNYPIELLVFSACQTAAGDNRATLGIAGIAVQSGARSTIASLWNVDDQATADLMATFYRELVQSATPISTPISKAEALRRAQVQLLKRRGYQAPLYWSPYLLVGNWL